MNEISWNKIEHAPDQEFFKSLQKFCKIAETSLSDFVDELVNGFSYVSDTDTYNFLAYLAAFPFRSECQGFSGRISKLIHNSAPGVFDQFRGRRMFRIVVLDSCEDDPMVVRDCMEVESACNHLINVNLIPLDHSRIPEIGPLPEEPEFVDIPSGFYRRGITEIVTIIDGSRIHDSVGKNVVCISSPFGNTSNDYERMLFGSSYVVWRNDSPSLDQRGPDWVKRSAASRRYLRDTRWIIIENDSKDEVVEFAEQIGAAYQVVNQGWELGQLVDTLLASGSN